ncbi:hypothetical protein ACFLV7_02400 [Chloroflexota bacterium]
MKKKLALLGVVILIALVTVTTALANHEKQSFTIGGHITAIGVDTITVETVKGSVTVKVTEDTSYLSRISEGVFDVIFFEDLELDDRTNIKYTIEDGVNVAVQVKVDVPLICR